MDSKYETVTTDNHPNCPICGSDNVGEFEEQKPSLNPPFSSVWICKGLLPAGNIFRKVNK